MKKLAHLPAVSGREIADVAGDEGQLFLLQIDFFDVGGVDDAGFADLHQGRVLLRQFLQLANEFRPAGRLDQTQLVGNRRRLHVNHIPHAHVSDVMAESVAKSIFLNIAVLGDRVHRLLQRVGHVPAQVVRVAVFDDKIAGPQPPLKGQKSHVLVAGHENQLGLGVLLLDDLAQVQAVLLVQLLADFNVQKVDAGRERLFSQKIQGLIVAACRLDDGKVQLFFIT